MARVRQIIDGAWMAKAFGELNLPQSTVSLLADISPTGICLAVAGRRGLSTRAQLAILDAVRFCRELKDRQDPVPVDFSNSEAILRLWRDAHVTRDEKNLTKTFAEESALPAQDEGVQ